MAEEIVLAPNQSKSADATLHLIEVEDARAFGCVPTAADGRVTAFLEKMDNPVTNQINAGLCAFFMIVAIVMIIASIGAIRRALASPTPTANEAPAVYTETPMTANSIKGE